MISIINLLKRFESTIAVDINSLTINKGEIFGIVGNNGAGKTTLLKLMLDLLKPDKGQVLSNNLNVYQSEHWKNYTGAYLDENFLVEFLKPEEYFEFIGFLHQIDHLQLKKEYDFFSSFLNGEIVGNDKYIRYHSAGDRQKIGLIGAMLSRPEVLILDEPFNRLDPSSQIVFKQLLLNCFNENTKIIILSSHDLNHISELCSRIVLMEKGKIIGDYMNDSDSLRAIEGYFNAQVTKVI